MLPPPLENPMQINLTLERETKNTVRFAEDATVSQPIIPAPHSWARSTSRSRLTHSSDPRSALR